ncbi:MAG TPA: citrate synthase [Trebonia sp.]|jgi:citrate synthase
MQMLDSEEAARRLGVKVPTLYAYVSRGLISTTKSPDGRRNLFSTEEIEERARRLRRARNSEIRVATIATGVSKLHEDGPSYRGVPAASLVASASYEEVADLLWNAEPGPWVAAPEAVDVAAKASFAARDRIRLAVVVAGATDPLRADLRPTAVTRSARRLIATAVQALDAGPTPEGDDEQAEVSIAERLSRRLGAPKVTPELVRAVNAVMVLLADHEIAPSTLVVRVAATTRADCYDALLAGLGTISGPLHGSASDVARRLLEDSEQRGVERALGETLRWQGSFPGFGHSDYVAGDPRFTALLPFFEAVAAPRQRKLLREVLARTESQGLPQPNVNLAIGAIAYAAKLAPEAGETLFTIARMTGWVAHYLEEIEESPRRFRTRTVFVGDS